MLIDLYLYNCNVHLLFSVVLAIGVKESSMLNNIFTSVNLLVVTYVVLCGVFKINFHNWAIPKDEVNVAPSCTKLHISQFFCLK